MPRFYPSVLVIASLLATGCAGTAGLNTVGVGAKAASNDSATAPLETVRPSLTTLEDSLILDLVLGYRARTLGGGDAETFRRARSAENQLDYMLRRGGVKDRGGEAKVITVDGDRLTLTETINQLSAALMRHTSGTAWRPEVERAREIQRRRPDLSALVEDAQWVLALAAALESPLPAATKAQLRLVHERYVVRAPHGEITTKVNDLLTVITEDALRRELKKLANRSWERERREGTPAAAPILKAPAAPARPATPPPPPPPPVPKPSLPDLPATLDAELPSGPQSPQADTSAPETNESSAIDALTTPDRYCAERRAEAAQAFAGARATADTIARTRQLNRSLELLDDCLTRYPDSPEAIKAKQNRDRVEQELKR